MLNSAHAPRWQICKDRFLTLQEPFSRISLLCFMDVCHKYLCYWSVCWWIREVVASFITYPFFHWLLVTPGHFFSLLSRLDVPLLNQTSSEPFASCVLPSSKTKGKGVWFILAMSHNANVPRFLSRNNCALNFCTAGLSCDGAFWETWVFRQSDNLFLLQNPLNQQV